MQTTALIVMGDMDWSELERVGRGPALIWLLTFFIVIVLLMLNMLLAIIFETYSEVRSKIGSQAETLPSQMLEIFRRRRDQQSGSKLSLDAIHKALLRRAATVAASPGAGTRRRSLLAQAPEKNPLVSADLARDDKTWMSA